ncbi:MAG: UDP-forming cellulose synthase catalytic subunit [Acetobacter sp.]
MMMLVGLFLAPSFQACLLSRQSEWKRQGLSSWGTGGRTILFVIAWLFLRLESSACQAVFRNRQSLYPQICTRPVRVFDSVRYVLQTLWLALVRSDSARIQAFRKSIARVDAFKAAMVVKEDFWIARLEALARARWFDYPMSRLVVLVALAVSGVVLMLCIMQPFDVRGQFIFSVALFFVAYLLRKVPGRVVSLAMVCMSLLISCRYMWWRLTSTLNWDDSLSITCGCFLLLAELYSWLILVLGYFQVSWPLHRQPQKLPEDEKIYPSVDIFIPTYNEPLNIVRTTVYGALGIDWPADKLTVWLLDDGGREEFRQFSEETGIRYLARTTHEYAKAGNINHALTQASGEFVAIFDCDHIPSRAFLQMTMGQFFEDSKLALVQTPHHFFSPDPFERNYENFRRVPNESALFYGLVQDGNDTWNATFFCGSCAVLKREALDAIGGIAVETVTEDAHTSLKLHRLGYNSAYIRIPLATGLATESLPSYIGQRLRWARGMTQILRVDNPFLGRGLSIAQRICYSNAMLHFLFGIPRLIFFLAPLSFLLLHAYIIYAPAIVILLFVLPYMIQVSMTNSRVYGQYRHTFWSEIYETVMAWYVAWPTLVTFFAPNKAVFNVTAKGGTIGSSYVNWVISRPYLLLIALNGVGIGAGIWRFAYGITSERETVIVSLLWVFYNLLILGGAISVAAEIRQVRQWQRVPVAMPSAVVRQNGHVVTCTIMDYANDSVGVEIENSHAFREGEDVRILLSRGDMNTLFPARIVRVSERSVGLILALKTPQEHIDFIRYTFSRADMWSVWGQSIPQDRVVRSLVEVIRIGARGYIHLFGVLPMSIRKPFRFISCMGEWLWSFVPRNPVY